MLLLNLLLLLLTKVLLLLLLKLLLLKCCLSAPRGPCTAAAELGPPATSSRLMPCHRAASLCLHC